jgi:hypothetical protein
MFKLKNKHINAFCNSLFLFPSLVYSIFSKKRSKPFFPTAYMLGLQSLGEVAEGEGFVLRRNLGILGSFDLSGKKRTLQFFE